MDTLRLLHLADRISTWTGKASAWLIVALMLTVCIEVFKRYMLNAPDAWIYDVNNMMYGTLFMMCGAYTLSQDAHVRGDFLYGSMKPRTQASLDLALYLLFFVPGIAALIYAGYEYAGDSWRIGERSNVSSNGPIVYPFKTIIPIAGALVMLQGLAEIARCVVCLKTGQWPERMKDVEEIDVVEQQLSASTHVDDESRKQAIDSVHQIEDAARQRGLGERAAEEMDVIRRENKNERSRTRTTDARANRGRDHDGLPDCIHTDGPGDVFWLHRVLRSHARMV
jgi:TRAP-type mannitol/chloroaromatic compound transport system permease small subunit